MINRSLANLSQRAIGSPPLGVSQATTAISSSRTSRLPSPISAISPSPKSAISRSRVSRLAPLPQSVTDKNEGSFSTHKSQSQHVLPSPLPIAHARAAAKPRRRRTAPAAAEGETTRISSSPGTRPPLHGRRREAVATRCRGRGEVPADGSTAAPLPQPGRPHNPSTGAPAPRLPARPPHPRRRTSRTTVAPTPGE